MLQAIDREIDRRGMSEDGEQVTRSIVIRDAIRQQLFRSKVARRAEKIGRAIIGSMPKCESVGCGNPAEHMDYEVDRNGDRRRIWWCNDHKTHISVAVEFVVEMKAAFPGAKHDPVEARIIRANEAERRANGVMR